MTAFILILYHTIISGIIVTRHIPNDEIPSSKLAEAFFRGRRQDNTTNTAPKGLLVQYGWGYCTCPGATTYSNTKTVTFPTPFSAVPLVLATGAGFIDNTNPSAITDLYTWEKSAVNAGSLTKNNFVVRAYGGGDTLAATRRMGFSWIAIGPA